MKNLHLLCVLTVCALLVRCTEDEPAIDITDIKFDGDKVIVKEGLTYDLTTVIEVVGADADQADISFSSADAAIVSVNGNILTAVKIGNTTVTATESNANLTTTLEVEVIANVVAVTGVTLDKSEANLKVGDTFQLTATIAPTDATEKGMTWSVAFPPESKNLEGTPENIATVSETGLVTAIAAGDVVVTATTTDGAFTESVDIAVTNVAVTGVTIDNDPISIAGRGTLQLTASIAPANATNKTIMWSLYLAQEARVLDEISNVIQVGVDYYAEIDTETGIITSKNPCDGCGLMAVATTFEGEFSHERSVEITYVAVSSITLDPSSFSVDVGSTQQMTPIIEPENASDINVSWSMSFTTLCDANPTDYATVSETGLVTGVAPEVCGLVVKAISESGAGVSTTSDVTVNPIVATSIEIYIVDETITDKKFDLLDLSLIHI